MLQFVSQRVVACCRVLQCEKLLVACRCLALCVAACCNVLQCVKPTVACICVALCVVVYCSVLQRVVVCKATGGTQVYLCLYEYVATG